MSLALKKSIIMRLIFDYELDKVAAIEKRSYPEDEALSIETIAHCEKSAPEVFLAAMKINDANPEHNTLVGYICGSLCAAGSLTEESMHTHKPNGEVYCIHSVCVDEKYRGKGIAKWMLQVHGGEWLPFLQPQVKSRNLICKQEQIGFFQSAGFELVGPSEIKRGARQWYEMRQDSSEMRRR